MTLRSSGAGARSGRWGRTCESPSTWSLDRPVSPGATGSFAAIDTASGLRLMFHQVPEGKTVKNRLHPDLVTSDYERETSRLAKLGAVKLNELEEGGTRWTTFADPEGNEFDLIATTA